MIEGRPFLYQAWDGTVYLVNEKGAKAIQSLPLNENIVAFVDGDEDNYDPNYMLRCGGVQIILATSPSGANRGWIKQADDVTIFATKLWSPHELCLAGFVLGSLLSTLG